MKHNAKRRSRFIKLSVLLLLLMTFWQVYMPQSDYTIKTRYEHLQEQNLKYPLPLMECISTHLQRMCPHLTVQSAEDIITAVIENSSTKKPHAARGETNWQNYHVTVCQEAWMPYHLHQLCPHLDLNKLLNTTILETSQFPYLLAKGDNLDVMVNRVRVYVSDNPSNTDLVTRLQSRLRNAGIEYELIDFGSVERMMERKDWIKRHVYSDFTEQQAIQGQGHDLATLTAFQFLDTLSQLDNENGGDDGDSGVLGGVYLETDAVPVPDFKWKLNSLMRQLGEMERDTWDMVFIGTCLDIENRIPIPIPNTNMNLKVSDNLYRMDSTRCFNGLIVKTETAKRIMQYGPVERQSEERNIDWLVNWYIPTLQLKVMWAMDPLVYEESKSAKIFT